MQLNNALGDGKSETGATFFLGIRIIDLMEFLKDTAPFGLGDAGASVSNLHSKDTVVRMSRNTDCALVGKLDGVSNQVEQHLGEAPLIASTVRHAICDLYLQWQLFGRCK